MKTLCCGRMLVAAVVVALALAGGQAARADVNEVGYLSSANPVRAGGKYFAVHYVWLGGGGTYQIDLMSRDFDTYLIVESPTGTVLGENDDGGEGLNSRLFFRPTTTGWYRVIATTYRAGATGHYRVVVVP